MKGFFPSLEKYQQLDELYKGKLLGFFSVKPEERKIKKILAPFACGKLFLELDFSRPKTVSAKSYVINYDRKFFLSPLKTKHSK